MTVFPEAYETPAVGTFEAEREAVVDAYTDEAIKDDAELPRSAVREELYSLAVTIATIEILNMLLVGGLERELADDDGGVCEANVTDEPS